MLNYKFQLDEESYIDCYIQQKQANEQLRQAILICPGGGYSHVSPREGEPVALEFTARGYNAYVLTYSTRDKSEAKFPVQLLQGYSAVKYIYDNAKEHHTDINKINVCGFSAGGHLAASIAVLHDCEQVNAAFGKNRAYKINRMVLCYPVISAISSPHIGSFVNLVGDNERLIEYVSLEKRVDKTTPSAFLWHTSDDATVDVRNSLEFASALRENGIEFELHVYPKGLHGLSLATPLTSSGNPNLVASDCAEWINLADRFLKKEI